MLTRTLASELAPQVRVNAIMPGVIETPHHETFSTPCRSKVIRFAEVISCADHIHVLIQFATPGWRQLKILAKRP